MEAQLPGVTVTADGYQIPLISYRYRKVKSRFSATKAYSLIMTYTSHRLILVPCSVILGNEFCVVYARPKFRF
jgi:hypothetical protein